ncbi:MAG: ATP-binding protein, partial [Synergistaceae bacterium]|nr:ATP-binding protein [Synergistaceae bacterium]
LWDKDLNVFGCNEENVRLFGLKDKQEFIDCFSDLAPEYQPDGRLSSEKTAYVKKAFEEGRCVFEWMHQKLDGTPIPTEVTLVRVDYEGDHAVAGYVRDLREHKRMMNDIEQRDRLLYAGHKEAAILLAAVDDENFEHSLLEGMQLIGHCVDADRVQIWQNEMIDGELYFVHKYEWLSEIGRQKPPVPIGLKFPYSDKPEWKEMFSRADVINSSLSKLSQSDRDFLNLYEMKSIVIIPLFLQNKFWGFFSIDDCRQERTFTKDEIDILQSCSLMMASAVSRHAQAAEIREAHNRAKLLLDATPLACRLWNRDFKIFECNDETVKLFGLKDKREFMERYFDLSPEYQPDGRHSRDTTHKILEKVFQEGRYAFEWMHRMPDGTPLPTEITLVRLNYGDEYVIAGYTRDLREHKRMMNEIEQRDHLLYAGNKEAVILLAAVDEEKFEPSLLEGMKLIGRCVDADRVQIWQNETIDGELYFVHKYEWLSEIGQQKTPVPIGLKYPYSDKPEWKEMFLRGEVINSPLSKLPQNDQDFLTAYDMKSIVVIPLFLQGKFWGFFSIDDCRQERTFTKDEIDILHSCSLMMVSALRRHDMTLDISATAAKLEVALSEARNANQSKSNFLARMSHEMRTPLNAILGLSELSLEAGGLNDEDYANLEKISNSGITLLSTVNDILDISKIEAGKLVLVPVKYDVPSLLNDTITQSITHIEDKRVEFVLNIDESLPIELFGDDLRVKQIFNNLLSNAFKYTKEGTVELGVHCDRDGETVWMTAWVRDTGIGIKPDDMNKLFSEYTQMDLESNRSIMGTGLGLPITKKMIEMMDGTISAKSEFGLGSV